MPYYMDYAATSAIRPPEVGRAVAEFLGGVGCTPGRGGHSGAVEAARLAFRCRRTLARVLDLPGDPGRIAFMQNATHALNTALWGLLCPGDVLVISQYDHNAVLRPADYLSRERGVEVRILSGSPDGAVDMDEAADALSDLVEEMEERQGKLGALEARNIAEANERGARLKRIVVVVDELADLLATHPETESLIVRLAQKARAVGIHLVLATQRPEAATFSGLLRSNVPSRIALTVQKSSESRIILDEPGAENLLMRGDMLVRFAGRSSVRAHGCLVQPGDIANEVRTR